MKILLSNKGFAFVFFFMKILDMYVLVSFHYQCLTTMHVYDSPTTNWSTTSSDSHDIQNTSGCMMKFYNLTKDLILWIGVLISGFIINLFTILKHSLLFIISLQMNDIAQTWTHHQPITSKQIFLILFEVFLYMFINSTREFSNRLYKENVDVQLHHMTNMNDDIK